MYFFNGYKQQYFMWEFVILGRKMMLILIVVMLSNFSFTIQILSALGVLILFLKAQMQYKPFSRDDLNELEKRSVAVTFITLLAAIFYNTEAAENDVSLWMLMILVFFANGYFIL